MSGKVTTRKLEETELKEMAKELEEEQKEIERERYWCPYCGRPFNTEKDFIRGWRFHSPKGGSYFEAKIYKCRKCQRKVRVVKKEVGIPLKSEEFV